jgi:hypothetical protein
VEISGFAEKNVGIWTIVSDLDADQVVLTSFLTDRSFLYNQTVYRPAAIGDEKVNSSLINCLGKIDARDNYFVSVGVDGNARLFDAELSLGILFIFIYLYLIFIYYIYNREKLLLI